jgi:signal peptidase II
VLFLSVLLVLADQLTKLAVRGFSLPSIGVAIKGLPYGTSTPVIGDFLRLTYVENPGMAFGIELGGKQWLALFSIAAGVGIVWYLYHSRHERLGLRISLALVLAGAVGNLIDRVFYGVIFDHAPLFYGRVVDFVDIDFFDLSLFGYHISRWPVFNVADSCVTVGVVMLLFFHRTVVEKEAVQVHEADEHRAPATHDQG